MWLFKLFFLNSANLICRGTDISKYFRESLGIRDNESRLYIESPVVLAHALSLLPLAKLHLSCRYQYVHVSQKYHYIPDGPRVIAIFAN